MKKAGIITIYDQTNYGNRLQNYAVQKILTSLGLEAKTYTCEMDMYKYNIGRKIRLKWRFHELTGYRFSANRSDWKLNYSRKLAFEDFTKKYIPTEQILSFDGLSERADYFVLGSDQVWNPTWYNNTNPTRKDMFLMTFARPEQKVCFAPSFGIEELPDEWRAWFQMQLATFPCVSVREQAGAKIINNLTGKTAEVLIDPTLMLDKKDWFRIAKRPKNVDVKHSFILTYFLGERPEQAEKDIQDIQRESKQTVYHFFDQSQPDIYACGPSEFLYLISKADIVLTDSFHASVFSFLFEKPFIVYERSEKDGVNMNSRLNTLLSMLDLKRKYKASGLKNGFFECNYRIGQEQLKEERMKAEKFLRKAMHL